MGKEHVSMAPVERCQEHLVADGEVERSKKMDGVVERARRCSECGARFKTFELTDDQLARQQGEHDMEVKDLKGELNFYKDVVERVKEMYWAERRVKDDLRMEYDFGNKDRD